MSSLLDSINEAVLLTYFTGKHLYANASYDAVVRKLKMKDLLELGCRESEYRVRHKDGSWHCRSAWTQVARDAAVNSTAFLSISRDALIRRQLIAERWFHPMEFVAWLSSGHS